MSEEDATTEEEIKKIDDAAVNICFNENFNDFFHKTLNKLTIQSTVMFESNVSFLFLINYHYNIRLFPVVAKVIQKSFRGGVTENLIHFHCLFHVFDFSFSEQENR